MQNIAAAFGSACFRVISLQWFGRYTATTICENCQDAVPPCVPPTDDATWNACLEAQRGRKLVDSAEGIEPALTALLIGLNQDYPNEGWDQYISPRGIVPEWSRIVIAGYSEGATQASYIYRKRPVPGAILISGGGERGTWISRGAGAEISADWLTQQPESSRVVGLYNIAEDHAADMPDGWSLTGMADTEATAVTTGWFYHDFHQASRLTRQTWQGDPHVSTSLPDMAPEHMYLACRADGQRTI